MSEVNMNEVNECECDEAFEKLWMATDKHTLYMKDFITKFAARNLFRAGWNATRLKNGDDLKEEYNSARKLLATFAELAPLTHDLNFVLAAARRCKDAEEWFKLSPSRREW